MRIAYPMRVDALDKPGEDRLPVLRNIEAGERPGALGFTAASSKSITFVMRHDAGIKPGGDADLAQTYVSLLQADGICATLTPSNLVVPEQVSYAVLFNLDQPLEAYLVARACSQAGVPFAIYTLHHKRRWTDQFLREGTFSLQRRIAHLLGSSSDRYETVLGALRLIRRIPVNRLLHMRSAGQMQKYLLTQADAVLVACSAEAEMIERDCDVKLNRVIVVPHYFKPYEPTPEMLSAEPEQVDILCAGRIEPRKNQLSLARFVAANEGRSIVFVGKKNTKHTQYLKEFDKLIASCSRIVWVDHVSKVKLHAYLRSCRTYVNVSWFEVFSLVDLIALQSGCRCICSEGSYLYDEFHGQNIDGVLNFVNPSRLSDLREILDKEPFGTISPIVLPPPTAPTTKSILEQWRSVFGDRV